MLPFRRVPVTFGLLVAIGLGFLAEVAMGGSTDQRVLAALGANLWPLEGQYWRLVASMFLHIGVLHLLVNSWALYQLGGLFELWLGHWRTALVFFATGIAGSVASLVFTLRGSGGAGLSAGASGAIFGILGALIAFLFRRREHLTSQAKGLLSQLLFWAGLNVFFGFTVPGIDNAAHLGGCAAGLLLGALFKDRRQFRRPAPPTQPAGEAEYIPPEGSRRTGGRPPGRQPSDSSRYE